METQPAILNVECEKSKSKSKSKVENLIAISHFAGNFSEIEDREDPDKDILMINLDTIKDYVQFLPFLKRGYGFSGGVARGALLELLGAKSPVIIDIDIETISELNPDESEKEELQETFLQNGRNEPISTNKSLIDYFNSRDFTINEVFLYGNNLYFSRRAAEDMENKIIRPTDYETNGEGSDGKFVDWDSISPKLLVKALLLEIEFIKQYGRGSIKDAEGWTWQIN